MDRIYCLIVNGAVLSDDICDFLFLSAHKMMSARERKGQLKHKELGIKGRIATNYKLAMLGTACGFTFTAEFESAGGETKTEFIVRPVSDNIFKELQCNGRWTRQNSAFCPPSAESWRN